MKEDVEIFQLVFEGHISRIGYGDIKSVRRSLAYAAKDLTSRRMSPSDIPEDLAERIRRNDSSAIAELYEYLTTPTISVGEKIKMGVIA